MKTTISAAIFFLAILFLSMTVLSACQPAPHEHTYVDGVCECGRTDPSDTCHYGHDYREGVCTRCGQEPPLSATECGSWHDYVEGLCTRCGQEEPICYYGHNYVDDYCTRCGVNRTTQSGLVPLTAEQEEQIVSDWYRKYDEKYWPTTPQPLSAVFYYIKESIDGYLGAFEGYIFLYDSRVISFNHTHSQIIGCRCFILAILFIYMAIRTGVFSTEGIV